MSTGRGLLLPRTSAESVRDVFNDGNVITGILLDDRTA